MVTTAVGLPGGSPYCPVSAQAADLPAARLPTRFNVLFRQHACVSLLRLRWDSTYTGCGILTACPSTMASPRGLRSRLTLGRLALPRNPWSFGEGVSRPLCRYLYLHLLFRALHAPSRPRFAARGMLPYRRATKARPTSSAPDLCPIIIHAGPLD